MFNCGKYVYSYQGRTYQRDVVIRVESEIDSKNIFDIFVRTWVPNYLSDFRQLISREQTGDTGIEQLASIDEK